MNSPFVMRLNSPRRGPRSLLLGRGDYQRPDFPSTMRVSGDIQPAEKVTRREQRHQPDTGLGESLGSALLTVDDAHGGVTREPCIAQRGNRVTAADGQGFLHFLIQRVRRWLRAGLRHRNPTHNARPSEPDPL